jgi:predicted aconitase
MFHMLGVTPEAKEYEHLTPGTSSLPRIAVTWQNLKDTWTEFNQNSEFKITPKEVDLISLGNPHFSLLELKSLSHLTRDRVRHPSTSVIVTTSRTQHSLAMQAGYIAQLEEFGVQVLTDTCWCFIRDPVIKADVKCIMTNSGKYAHYGPGLTGREFCFGGLEECVEVACSRVWKGEVPGWIEAGIQGSQ